MAATDSTARGLRAVLIATAVAGIVGYAIQLSAPVLIENDADYVSFSVFWSTLYLGGAAISGVQQEVARAARPRAGGGGGRTLLVFASGAALLVGAASVVVTALVGEAILPGAVGYVGVALLIGLVGYLATSVLTGLYYGLHLWAAVAFAVIADALIRAVLVIAGLLLAWDTGVLAVLVAVPFGLAAAAGWLVFRGRLVGRSALDVGLRRLTANASSTVLAATASGVMISGLPMLIGLTSPAASAEDTGAYLLAVTVTRAPIVIPVIALQSFLIAAVFRGREVSGGRVLRLIAVVLLGGAALSALGWLIGPPILELISGGRFRISGGEAAAIVFSATLVAGMCITGPALIAVRLHVANVVGWVVAAALTIVALVLPLGEARLLVALTAPAAVGLALHVGALVTPRRRGGHRDADRSVGGDDGIVSAEPAG